MAIQQQTAPAPYTPPKPLADVTKRVDQADAWVQNKFATEGKQTPFLSTVGKETYDIGAGTMKGLGGLFTGNWDRAKAGAKQMGGSILSAMTGGALRGMNQAPERQYLGGSPEAQAQRQALYAQGIGQGNTMLGGGLITSAEGANMLGQAGGMAQADRGYGYGLAGGGLGEQQQALAASRALAAQPTDSLAQIQLRQGLAQNQQQMLGQAAQARGGNQAAAIRNAQMQGANMGLQTNAQAASLRAAEQQAALNRRLGVEQLASQVGGQQLGLGLGQVNQGTGNYGQFAGQIGNIGLGQGQLGLGSQGQYLGAQTETDKALLGADTQHASAAKAAQGGIMGVAGKVIGSIFGGG